MSHDDLFHDCTGFFHVVELFIKFHHSEQVVHRRKRGIQLIVHHVGLLCRQRVGPGDGFRVPLIRGFSAGLLHPFVIELRDLFRSPAQKDLRGSQVREVTLGDQGDRGKGIPSQFIKIVVDADLFEAKCLCKSFAELFLGLCLRRRIVGVKTPRFRAGERSPVQLAAGL